MEIRANKRKYVDVSNVEGTDELIQIEATAQAFKMFRRYGVYANDETRTVKLIPIDADMTSTIESFAEICHGFNAEAAGLAGNDSDKVIQNESGGCKNTRVKWQKSIEICNEVLNDGHSLPMRTTRMLKTYLALTCGQLIGKVTTASNKVSKQEELFPLEKEFQVHSGTNEAYGLRNDSRKFRFAYHYPGEGFYYIVLLPGIFNKAVCTCYGFPFDFYLLSRKSPYGPLVLYNENDDCELLNSSDEQDEDFPIWRYEETRVVFFENMCDEEHGQEHEIYSCAF